MNESLLVAGIVCIVASIVGGGIKLLGAEVPVLNSFARQALLFTVGLAFLAASYLASLPKSAAGPALADKSLLAPPAASASAPILMPAQVAPPAQGACSTNALACLPPSSKPVVFASNSAARAEAARNIAAGLSTTEAAARASSDGASGKDARLCGIVLSNDSSPYGKHVAALRLAADDPADGQASGGCLGEAAAFR